MGGETVDVYGVEDEEQESGVGQGEQDPADDEPQEALDPLRRKCFSAPTEEEVRRQRVTHIPFREWCPECAGHTDFAIEIRWPR